MCRLLGSVSRTPVTVDQVLGTGRRAFLELAVKHGDGWGHAWSSGGSLRVTKAPGSALDDADFAAVAGGEPAEAALTHLRWATLGLHIGLDNTHPFTDGTVAFAHNGSIAPPAALDALIAPDVAGRREGDTDSERYFLALLSRLPGRDAGTALATTVRDILASEATVLSLNCMLLTPDALYAVCSYAEGHQEDPHYYPLLYRATGETVVVASTGWTDRADWRSLTNGQMLVVERGSLRTSVMSVDRPLGVASAGQ